ncbi:MAG: hypothetical protein HQK51_20085, partial [Oligoflexia bacterium]|nr:hypothetical protein [Oligoflexia bacterium]
WLNWLDIKNLFYYHSFFALLTIIALALILQTKQYRLFDKKDSNDNLKNNRFLLPKKEVLILLKDFYSYSGPLFTYSLISLIVSMFDRWMLQKISGSVEQGFFGMSVTISSFSMIFTGAMIPLFMREFAISFDKIDYARMRHLFKKNLMFFIR